MVNILARMPNAFPNLDHFVRQYHLHLPKPHETWRLVADPLLGSINGLGRFIGFTIATNGIMVALLTSSDRVVFGHLQWFIPDASEKDAQLSDLWDTPSSSTTKRHNRALVTIQKDYSTW